MDIDELTTLYFNPIINIICHSNEGGISLLASLYEIPPSSE
ncbi:hypothetical protein [Flavobacterium sp.]